MQFTIDLSEKDVLEFGKLSLQQEFAETLKWMKLKRLCRGISEGLKPVDPETYAREVEAIRKAAWNEYSHNKERP